MKFARVIPCLKMPFGTAFFDYKSNQSESPGDLIRVPFRNKTIPALVVDKISDTPFKNQAKQIPPQNPIIQLPPSFSELCITAAEETAVSPPTILSAWLRTIPKRQKPTLPTRFSIKKTTSEWKTEWTANRYTKTKQTLEVFKKNRVLLITPWQHRAEFIAKKENARLLHAGLSAGTAWRTWTEWLNQPNGILVTTRIGAWLSIAAECVLIDEPENDDHKQDELSPRYDARQIVRLAKNLNPQITVIEIGTTPPIQSKDSAPEINPTIQWVPFRKEWRSEIESVTQPALDAIMEAVSNKKNVRILHPITGDRGRIRCRDCGWTFYCPSCERGYTSQDGKAVCRACGKKEMLPPQCPACGGSDLLKSAIGASALEKKLKTKIPSSSIRVFNLPEWIQVPLSPNTLIIITTLSLIGGHTEDIRRRERLIIAFRRFAAQCQAAACPLIIQGPDELLEQAQSWLTTQGLQHAWKTELEERKIFGYPPAVPLIKLLIRGTEEECIKAVSAVKNACEKVAWQFRGPFPVEHLPKGRPPRCIFHLLPDPSLNRAEQVQVLAPLTALGIVDLDPIAFFC